MKTKEKTINGLNIEQWIERYISYFKKYVKECEWWIIEELAHTSWDETVDETPEESAQEELFNWYVNSD